MTSRRTSDPAVRLHLAVAADLRHVAQYRHLHHRTGAFLLARWSDDSGMSSVEYDPVTDLAVIRAVASPRVLTVGGAALERSTEGGPA